MNPKFLYTSAVFILILLSGFWVSRAGKPYNVGIFTLHKLAGLAAGIYLGRRVYLTHQATPLSGLAITLVVISGLLFLGLVGTGGALSAMQTPPLILNFIHKVLPYLTILSTSGMLYVLIT